MKPSRRLALASVALAALSAPAYFAFRQTAPVRAMVTRAETALGVQAPRASLAWPKGQAYRYSFEWRATSAAKIQAEIAEEPMRGAAAVKGEMILGAIADRPGGRLLSVRFENISEHRLEILGKQLIPTAEEAKRVFEGREAYVEISERGTVGKIYFKKDEPAAFKQIAEMVLSQLDVSLPAAGNDAAEWTVTERAPSGDARSRYRIVDGDPMAMTRVREAYESISALPPGVCDADCAQTLDAQSTIKVDPRGCLDELRADETLRLDTRGTSVFAGETHAVLKLLGIERLAVASNVELDMHLLEGKVPGEASVTEESKHAILVRLADGLTPQQLDDQLRSFAMLGADSVPDGWLTRASALLRLDPSLCQGLAMMFEEPSIPVSGRATILDVLASAGTSEAQRAMRDALDSPAASSEAGSYVRLVQRFAFLQKPDVASSEYLARAYEGASDRDAHFASAFALGATISRLGPAGNAPAARALGDKLVTDLHNAKDAEDQRALLTALGNAGRASDAAEIKRFSQAESADIRRAAAAALRKSPAEEAQRTLVGMIGDPDVDVENEALRSLNERPLTSDSAQKISDIVTSGVTSQETDRTVVSLLATHASDDGVSGVSRNVLQYILARTQDRRLEARIRMILEGMGQPG